MSGNSTIVNIGSVARQRQVRASVPPVAGNPPFNFSVLSYPIQTFSFYRMIGGALNNTFRAAYLYQGAAPSPPSAFTITEYDSVGPLYSTLITPATVSLSLGTYWIGAADSSWGGTAADCALMATEYSHSDTTSPPGTPQELEIAPLLYLPPLQRYAMHLHRAPVSGLSYVTHGIGGAIAHASYLDRPRSGLGGYTHYRVLSGRGVVILPGYGRGYVGVVAPIYADETGSFSALAEMAFIELEDDYVQSSNPTDRHLVSAIAKDPRNGVEHITCGRVVLATYLANMQATRSLFTLTRPQNASPLAACSYMRVSLVSAALAGLNTAGFNNVARRAESTVRLARGSSTGGNTAMPMDYEPWDFAATCKREFLAQGVPYTQAGDLVPLPASHQNVQLAQYNTLQIPDVRGIGSPSSMLPLRESIPHSAEKAYYHYNGEGNLADLKKGDFSLVMLKSLSLVSHGYEAADASSLVPVVSPSDNATFRFAGNNITGTTVRFAPVSAQAGVSFGRTQNPGPLPQWDATPASFLMARYWQDYSTATPPDWSGEFWARVDYGSGTGAGQVTYAYNVLPSLVVLSQTVVFAVAQSAGVPENTALRIYDYVLCVPPHSEGYTEWERAASRGMHNRKYDQSQTFVAGGAWDESGYVAGALVSALLSRTLPFPVSPQFGLVQTPPPLLSTAYPNAPSGEMLAVMQNQLPAVLPIVCEHDYECTAQPIAGKQPTAGLFSYDGPGPTVEVQLPYIGRGMKATITHRQPFPPASNWAADVYADVSYEPLDISATFTATLATEQVSVWVQWHASLQGLGAYVPRASDSQEGIDIDDQRGAVSPFHYVRTSRAGELSPVLVADLWFTARGRATVSAEATFPEGLPQMETTHEAKRELIGGNSITKRPLQEFDLVSRWNYASGGSGGATEFGGNYPDPINLHSTQNITIDNKLPFYAGTFVFNRDQTAALLRGESVAPTRWMEFPEGDPRGNEPQALRWHNSTFATIVPKFRLSLS